MNFTDFRLKAKRIFRKYKKIILICALVFVVIFLINYILAHMPEKYEATTTLDVHTSVIDSNNSTPKYISSEIEKKLEEYVGYCNEGNYQRAFDMLADDCKKYSFDDDIEVFMRHVLVKMPTPKKYAIQSYSKTTYGNNTMYVYEVKYADDYLATGLTQSEYGFTSEKFTFYYTDEGVKMNAGDYLYHTDIKNISENEYLKIDVVDKIVNYSIEQYELKLTNRSNYTIVISDNQEVDEIVLTLPQEVRKRSEVDSLVLEPNQTITVDFTFPKFADDGDTSQSILFSSIRVMEKYSGVNGIAEEVIQSEIDNAISKFSMEVKVNE